MSNSTLSPNTLVVERLVDAPAQLVWQLWTDPEHFKQWYGPQSFSVPVAEFDVRVGGKRVVCMEGQTPRGKMTMWTAGEHLVVTPHEHLVYSESMADEKGNILSTSTPDHTPPSNSEVSVHLEAQGQQTKMILKHAGLPENAKGASSGWQQAFDKLTSLIEKLQ